MHYFLQKCALNITKIIYQQKIKNDLQLSSTVSDNSTIHSNKLDLKCQDSSSCTKTSSFKCIKIEVSKQEKLVKNNIFLFLSDASIIISPLLPASHQLLRKKKNVTWKMSPTTPTRAAFWNLFFSILQQRSLPQFL